MENKDLQRVATLSFLVCFCAVTFFFGMLSAIPIFKFVFINFIIEMLIISTIWSAFMTLTFKVIYGKKK